MLPCCWGKEQDESKRAAKTNHDQSADDTPKDDKKLDSKQPRQEDLSADW